MRECPHKRFFGGRLGLEPDPSSRLKLGGGPRGRFGFSGFEQISDELAAYDATVVTLSYALASHQEAFCWVRSPPLRNVG